MVVLVWLAIKIFIGTVYSLVFYAALIMLCFYGVKLYMNNNQEKSMYYDDNKYFDENESDGEKSLTEHFED